MFAVKPEKVVDGTRCINRKTIKKLSILLILSIMYPERINVLVFFSFNAFPILEHRNIYLILTRAQTPLAILYYAASLRNLTRA